jgi:hypothetical protein
MRLLTLAAALTALCAAQPALSRDTGTINQAGPYEQTMRFYLHPAHFFWSSEAPRQEPMLAERAPSSHKNDAALMMLQPPPAQRTEWNRALVLAQPARN